MYFGPTALGPVGKIGEVEERDGEVSDTVSITVSLSYHSKPVHYGRVPYNTIPYHLIPYHTLFYHNKVYHTIQYHTIPFDTIPYLILR